MNLALSTLTIPGEDRNCQVLTFYLGVNYTYFYVALRQGRFVHLCLEARDVIT
jgi:hypothetical protein